MVFGLGEMGLNQLKYGRNGDLPETAMEKSSRKFKAASSTGKRYPAALGQDADLQHFVRFQIFEYQKVAYQAGDQTDSTGGEEPATLLDTIDLYIPEQVAMKTTASYENQSTNAFQNMLIDQQGEGGVLAGVGSGLFSAAAKGANFLTGEGSEDIALANLGIAANASKVLLFKGIDFRTFSFSYKFAPKNSAESDAVQRIIMAFRKGMLPNFASGGAGMLYVVPDQFEISYNIDGDATRGKNWLHKFKTCSLVDCDINYGGDGSFGVFKESGAPTNVTMNLTFQETLQVTKDDVEANF